MTYNIEEGNFQNLELQIPETCRSYIEQIEEESLLISGNYNYKNCETFIKYDQGDIRNFEMNIGRNDHRTIYNQKELDYIISGNDMSEDKTKDREVYKFSNNSFTIISDIPEPVSHFALSLIQEQVLTFGEFSFGYIDKIYPYNTFRNSWVKHQLQIPKPWAACSAYLKEVNSCLVYSGEFESQMFDFKQKSRHGETFKGNPFVFTNAINYNDAVYQFDFDTVLYCYELNNAKWEKIE